MNWNPSKITICNDMHTVMHAESVGEEAGERLLARSPHSNRCSTAAYRCYGNRCGDAHEPATCQRYIEGKHASEADAVRLGHVAHPARQPTGRRSLSCCWVVRQAIGSQPT